MVRSIVDSVDSNGVDTQLLELGNISSTSICVGNGICYIGGATRLVVNAANVESIVSGKECYENRYYVALINHLLSEMTYHCP
jgi:hypothetical protein